MKFYVITSNFLQLSLFHGKIRRSKVNEPNGASCAMSSNNLSPNYLPQTKIQVNFPFYSLRVRHKIK
jgi:hypothetical protein